MPIPPNRICISPNYKLADYLQPWALDVKIKIFEDRVLGWQLDIAEQCLKIKHSGFAVLSIVLSYFEMIAKYQEGYCGKGKSEEYFKKGVRSVFPMLKKYDSKTVDKALDVLYKGARCGIYHQVSPDPRIVLTGDIKRALQFNPRNSKLTINPHKIAPKLKKHFQEYIRQLREGKNKELRENFERRFDYSRSLI